MLVRLVIISLMKTLVKDVKTTHAVLDGIRCLCLSTVCLATLIRQDVIFVKRDMPLILLVLALSVAFLIALSVVQMEHVLLVGLGIMSVTVNVFNVAEIHVVLEEDNRPISITALFAAWLRIGVMSVKMVIPLTLQVAVSTVMFLTVLNVA